MQHLQTMSEDKSYKSADRQKFKGWLRKRQQARIPLLACLFVEILSLTKLLSLAFQDNNIDTVSSIQRLETAKKQLARLERKNFEDLPTVKRFLDKVEELEELWVKYEEKTMKERPSPVIICYIFLQCFLYIQNIRGYY